MTMSSSHWGGLTNRLNDRLKVWEYGSIVVVRLLSRSVLLVFCLFFVWSRLI